jgi:cytochrome c-type biogenesis protein CcsB
MPMTATKKAASLLAAMAIALALGGAPASAQAPISAPAGGDRAAFAAQVNLVALGTIAVQQDGRVKTFDSFARETMALVSGGRPFQGQPPTLTYLDLMLRPEAYEDAEIVFVKSKVIRGQIADVLHRSMQARLDEIRAGDPAMAQRLAADEASVIADLEGRLDRFVETGLISQPMLFDPAVRELLARLEADVIRSAKYVQAIQTAVTLRQPRFLRDSLRVVPPAGGGEGFDRSWLTLESIADEGELDPGVRGELVGAWQSLTEGWRAGDAARVNAAIGVLSARLPLVNPELYPDQTRLEWERWYFRWKNMTWVWLVYALALVPLVLHVVFRWSGARWLGLAIFLAGFGLHTFAVMLRWYVAERWPNSNMFEAVTTSAWFGGCLALVLELALRRSALRGLFALCSSTASMVALMAAHFMPLQLNPGISNMMPVLHDVWLYIHTNVIILSYCLIFMASVTGLAYLVHRGAMRMRGATGVAEYARVGGAGTLILGGAGGPGGAGVPSPRAAVTTLGQVLDGTTMILLELSFVLLWSGIVMGAIWADHSWGRPWGWDPKEVFALNTFIVFALLVHIRLKVRDKGLWTALLAVAGCAVMLFNWIVINFTIAGLHSYA